MPVHKTINSSSLLFAKDMIFGKRLTSNNLKMNNIMLNVEQLKMKKFIKYIWQLIIVPRMLHLRYPRYAPLTVLFIIPFIKLE